MTFKHGPSGYKNHHCRCPTCRIGNTIRQRIQRNGHPYLVAGNRKTTRTHGIRTTYKNGCRCTACTEAERVYKAEYRARRR